MFAKSSKPMLRFVQVCASIAAALVAGGAIAQSASSPNLLLQVATSLGSPPGTVYGVSVGTAAPVLTPSSVTPLVPTAPTGVYGFSSLAYVPSSAPGATVDLIAADSFTGRIVRFQGPNFTSATTIWPNGGGGAGPQHPHGIAVDLNSVSIDPNSGTLYVVSSDVQSDNTSVPELWAFPGAGGPALPATPVSPVLIQNLGGVDINNDDANNSPDERIGPPPQTMADILVAPANAAPPLNPGDVLVLFGDQDVLNNGEVPVLAQYPAAALQAALAAGATPTTCNYFAGQTTALACAVELLDSDDIPGWGSKEAGASVAFQPNGQNILILASGGDIYTMYFSAIPNGGNTQINAGLFGPGLSSNPAGAYTSLRTGTQSSTPGGTPYPYVFVAGSNGTAGVVALLDGNSGAIDSTVTQTSGGSSLTSLSGLAVIDTQTAVASNCLTGCNPTGGQQLTIVPATPAQTEAVQSLTGSAALITQSVCKVLVDPRGPNCGANPATSPPTPPRPLLISQVCPQLNTGNLQLADYQCGASGNIVPPNATPLGFVILQSVSGAGGIDSIPNLLFQNSGDINSFLPVANYVDPATLSPLSPLCFAVWGPLPGEGQVNALPPNLEDYTSGCGSSSKGTTSKDSIFGIGLSFDIGNGAPEGKGPWANPLQNYIQNVRYSTFEKVLLPNNTNIDFVQRATVLAHVVASEAYFEAGNAQSAKTPGNDGGYYSCAARQLWLADTYVANPANVPHFQSSANYSNSYGAVRSYLQTIYFALYSRLAGQPYYNNLVANEPEPACSR